MNPFARDQVAVSTYKRKPNRRNIVLEKIQPCSANSVRKTDERHEVFEDLLDAVPRVRHNHEPIYGILQR